LVQLNLLCCLACGYCGYNQKDSEIYYDDDEEATMKTNQFFEE
jgi:2-iminoacetate synthase ThiH